MCRDDRRCQCYRTRLHTHLIIVTTSLGQRMVLSNIVIVMHLRVPSCTVSVWRSMLRDDLNSNGCQTYVCDYCKGLAFKIAWCYCLRCAFNGAQPNPKHCAQCSGLTLRHLAVITVTANVVHLNVLSVSASVGHTMVLQVIGSM